MVTRRRCTATAFVLLTASACTEATTEQGEASDAAAERRGGALLDAPSLDACSGPETPARDAPASCVVPDPRPTFSRDVAPILARCGGETCHDSTWAGPRPRASLVGQPALGCCGEGRLVVPGDPAGSYLVRKLRGVDLCSGGRMPEGKPPLDDEATDSIAGWICAGALDD